MSAILALFVSLLIGQGFSQCFTNTDCTGGLVEAADQRACCVGTDDGLSFNDGTTCTLCIVHGFRQSKYDVEENERLGTRFQLNVKGTTQFGGALVVTGLITAAADGTASTSDFERLAPIRVTNAEIRLFAANDDITLEYDDRVLLRFTPDIPDLIPGLEANGEYIRDTATVNIIDKDLLEINFGDVVQEGSTVQSSLITFQFRTNQNPFNITLSPVTVDTAESMGLGFFINSASIPPGSRATAVTDFSDQPITVEVPAHSRTFRVTEFFTIVDDDIDEDEQSFAIVAEIGPDVPENIGCFQTGLKDAECHGRRGATEIRITDNDPMIIGFTERFRTVSEGQVPGVDLFQLIINVASARTAEREHPMVFRLLESISNATVETLYASSPVFDATFGVRTNPDDPIEETRSLHPGSLTVTPTLLTAIRNDLMPEDTECYTIRIFPVDVPSRRELFTCNEDGVGEDNYFCEHTICIEDDDEPFVVAFVKTTYTVDESVGAVNVCVNLTQPEIDILEHTVNVFVIDYYSSVYIPAGAPLATPDIPDFLSRYHMIEGSDYVQQTSVVNAIDDTLISEIRRIVCYNQTIYDDQRVELDEYAGLTLGIKDNRLTTIITLVKPEYDQAAILIIDNDRAEVGLELTYFIVSESAGSVELCVAVFSPAIQCPIPFPLPIILTVSNRSTASQTDFRDFKTDISLEACETRRCVNVEIVDDSINEGDETLYVTLTTTPNLTYRIQFHPQAAKFRIIDNNDPLDLEIIDLSYSGVIEAGMLGPTLTCRVTVTEAERATVLSPSALWLRYSTLSAVPENDSSVFTTTTRNATTATTIISFSLLYTSHAGPYTCQINATNSTPSFSPLITLTVKLPTPTVNLSQDASGLLYEGSAVTLTCAATLPPSVDTDVNITVQWTPTISSDRVSISTPSSSRSPFTSTLTISPLAIADTGHYYCEVTVHSSSQYIVASDPGISPRFNLMVQSVEQNLNDTVGSGGDQGSTTSTLIIGVVVVIALIIIASIILLIIVVFVLRRRHSAYSLKNGLKLEEQRKKDNTIKTSTNEAYGEIQQGEGYEMIVMPPSGPTAPTDEEGMYEIPSVSTQPLPAIPPTGDKEEKEDGVYEAIPGDN